MADAKCLTPDEVEFVRIIYAASRLGDGRQRHIKAYKRLTSIIEKLAPGTARWTLSKEARHG